MLMIFRVLAGIGLGGATPCFIALTSEYAPARLRAALGDADVVGVSARRDAGRAVELVSDHAARAGARSSISAVSRRSFLPSCCCFICRNRSSSCWSGATTERPLHASSRASALRPCAATRILSWMKSRCPARRSGICSREGRALGTLLLWVPFFMGFGVLTVAVLWTPALLRLNGISPANTAFVVAFNGLGGFIGQSTAGRLIERFGILHVLFPAFLLGAAATVGLGYGASSVALAATFIGLIGVFMGFGTGGAIALAATDLSDSDPIHRRRLGNGHGPFWPDRRSTHRRSIARRRLDGRSDHDRHRLRRTDRRGFRRLVQRVVRQARRWTASPRTTPRQRRRLRV